MTNDKSRPNEEMPVNHYIDDEFTAKCRKDAERGDPDAQNAQVRACLRLVMACIKNFDLEGESANTTEALRWLRKAAEQNHAESQFTLGLWYELGRFIPKNVGAAVTWYRKPWCPAGQGRGN